MPHESQLHLPFNLLTKSLLGSLEQTPEGGNLSKTALIALFALHLEEEMSQLQELQVVEKDDGYELGAYGDAGDLIPVSRGARPVQYALSCDRHSIPLFALIEGRLVFIEDSWDCYNDSRELLLHPLFNLQRSTGPRP